MGPEAVGLVPLVLCLAVAILLGHAVHVRRIFFLTEATVSLLVGMATGGAVLAYYMVWKGVRIPATLVEFNTQIFFDVLLPPIIFNAGFSVKKKSFFRNFTTLVLYGVLGTFSTSALIATGCYSILSSVGLDGHLVADSLALGTIFSSTDSVATLQILDQDTAPVLYSLIFGEGVVNDATSIVLLRAVQKISRKSELTADTLMLVILNFSRLFVLSLLLGAGVGLVSASLIKRSFVHHSTDREVSLMALLGFLAYLLAEELQLSGIFSVFFAGLTMSHYTWHNLSPSAKVVTVYLFRIVSFTAELFLFLYAGFSMWSTTLWQGDIYTRASAMRTAGLLAAALVVLVFAARALTLIPLTLLANTWRPAGSKITVRQWAVIWWAGSMRGAVTVAMAFQNFGRQKEEPTDNQVLVVASNAAVIFITVVLGAVTSTLLGWLIPKDELAPANTFATLPSIQDGVSPPLLATALHWNRASPIYRAWHHVDQRWLRPLFGGRAPHAAGYRSPPPSPGKRIIQRVMGPGIMKRLGADALEAEEESTAPGSSLASSYGAASSHGPAAALRQPLLGGSGGHVVPPPSSAPGLSNAKSGKRRPDAFRLWPAALEPEVPAAEAGARSAAPPRAAAAATPPLSVRSLEALDMHPSTAVEELFNCDSNRLDSLRSQQLDWKDSRQYGEAAWLAAGAPSDNSSGASGSQLQQAVLGEEEGAGEEAEGAASGAGPPARDYAARRSPFQ